MYVSEKTEQWNLKVATQTTWADMVRNKCRWDLVEDTMRYLFPSGIDKIVLSYDPYKYTIPTRIYYCMMANTYYCDCGKQCLDTIACMLCGLSVPTERILLRDQQMKGYYSLVHEECYKFISINHKFPTMMIIDNRFCVNHISLYELDKCQKCSKIYSRSYPHTCRLCKDRVRKNMVIIISKNKYRGCFLHDHCYGQCKLSIPPECNVIKRTQKNHNDIFCCNTRHSDLPELVASFSGY